MLTFHIDYGIWPERYSAFLIAGEGRTTDVIASWSGNNESLRALRLAILLGVRISQRGEPQEVKP